MMLSLAFVSTIAEILSNKKTNVSTIDAENETLSHHSPVHHSLQD